MGFDRAQGFAPVPGEELKYQATGNVLAHNGTITFWLNARDFKPAEDTGRGNIAIVRLHFTDSAKRWIDYTFYEYKGTLWADWRTSEPPHNWGDTCTLSIPAKMWNCGNERPTPLA